MKDLLLDIAFVIITFIKKIARPIAIMLEILTPYAMLFMGMLSYRQRGNFSVGGEIFVPAALLLLSVVFFKIDSKVNNTHNDKLPIPRKRFTTEYEDGEIEVEEDNIQEMIVYMCEVENYLERKGYVNRRKFRYEANAGGTARRNGKAEDELSN